MKKVVWVFALIILVFLGDRVGGWVCEKLTENSQFRYSRIYNGNLEAELLFVGNSRGLMFYQPHVEETVGLSTLNISYNGMPIDLANVIIQDHFEKNVLPKTMLIDVTMCDRQNQSLISGFSPYRAYSERLEQLIKQNAPKSYYGGGLSHLFLYNNEIFQRALYYLNKSDEDWLIDREMNQNLVDLIKAEKEYTITTNGYLLNSLTELVQTAKNHEIDVKLVVNPYYPPFAAKITNLEDFINQVEDRTSLKVYDYSMAYNNVKGFGDYQHLNKFGSIEYLNILIEDGILPSKQKKLSSLPN